MRMNPVFDKFRNVNCSKSLQMIFAKMVGSLDSKYQITNFFS